VISNTINETAAWYYKS